MSALDVLQVLDSSGHFELKWDPADPVDRARALAEIRRLREAGYAFFTVADPTDPMGGGEVQVHHVDDLVTAPEPEPEAEPEPEVEPETTTCTATKADGSPCDRAAKPGTDRCGYHRRGRSKGGRRSVAVPPMRGG